MAEYGDPDIPEQWAYIQTWSPYHLLRKDAKYPTPFIWTNTRDDRVHPGHARKMVARMQELGHPVYYFENVEGGHGAGVRQHADRARHRARVRLSLEDAGRTSMKALFVVGLVVLILGVASLFVPIPQERAVRHRGGQASASASKRAIGRRSPPS